MRKCDRKSGITEKLKGNTCNLDHGVPLCIEQTQKSYPSSRKSHDSKKVLFLQGPSQCLYHFYLYAITISFSQQFESSIN